MSVDPSKGESGQIDWSCLRCGGQFEDGGEVGFREGGMGPAGHFFLGGLAELGEGILHVRVLTCTRCGEIVLVDPDRYPG